MQLVGGDRVARAAIYPPGLCRAICKGVRKQLEDEKRTGEEMMNLEIGADDPEDDPTDERIIELSSWEEVEVMVEVSGRNEDEETAWDDVKGGPLNASRVRAAKGRGNGIRSSKAGVQILDH